MTLRWQLVGLQLQQLHRTLRTALCMICSTRKLFFFYDRNFLPLRDQRLGEFVSVRCQATKFHLHRPRKLLSVASPASTTFLGLPKMNLRKHVFMVVGLFLANAVQRSPRMVASLEQSGGLADFTLCEDVLDDLKGHRNRTVKHATRSRQPRSPSACERQSRTGCCLARQQSSRWRHADVSASWRQDMASLCGFIALLV